MRRSRMGVGGYDDVDDDNDGKMGEQEVDKPE